jgi:hypothetical protein
VRGCVLSFLLVIGRWVGGLVVGFVLVVMVVVRLGVLYSHDGFEDFIWKNCVFVI